MWKDTTIYWKLFFWKKNLEFLRELDNDLKLIADTITAYNNNED
jgi:hypothetical protein